MGDITTSSPVILQEKSEQCVRSSPCITSSVSTVLKGVLGRLFELERRVEYEF